MSHRRVNENDVPESQHTIFIRGLPGSVSTTDVRTFFEEAIGPISFDFVKVTEDRRNFFVAVRFETKAAAKECLEKYDNTELFGHRVKLTYFRDIRRFISHREGQRRDARFRRDDYERRARRYERSRSRSDQSRSRSRSPQRLDSSSPRSRSRTRSRSKSSVRSSPRVERRRNDDVDEEPPMKPEEREKEMSASPPAALKRSKKSKREKRRKRRRSPSRSRSRTPQSPSVPAVNRPRSAASDMEVNNSDYDQENTYTGESNHNKSAPAAMAASMLSAFSPQPPINKETTPPPPTKKIEINIQPHPHQQYGSYQSQQQQSPQQQQQFTLQQHQQSLQQQSPLHQMLPFQQQSSLQHQQQLSQPSAAILQNTSFTVDLNSNNLPLKKIKKMQYQQQQQQQEPIGIDPIFQKVFTQQNSGVLPEVGVKVSVPTYGFVSNAEPTTEKVVEVTKNNHNIAIVNEQQQDDVQQKKPPLPPPPPTLKSRKEIRPEVNAAIAAAETTLISTPPTTASLTATPIAGGGTPTGKFKEIQKRVLDDVRYKAPETNGENVVGNFRLSLIPATIKSAEAIREERIASLPPTLREKVDEKKRQLEAVYRNDCTTFGAVTRRLIAKDLSLEDRLRLALLEALKDLESETKRHLDDYIEELSSLL